MKRLFFLVSFFAFTATILGAQSLDVRSIQGLDASGDNFVHFNLETGEVVTSEAAGFGGWDIAFQGTNIQINGEGRFMDVVFDSLKVAPEDGFLSEDSGPVTLPSGGTDGWFSYDFNSHIISPVSNRLILVKTKAGMYAKLEIIDYYKVTFGEQGPAPTPRFYSFKYVLQKDGSRNFSN